MDGEGRSEVIAAKKKLNYAEKRAARRSLPKIWQKSPRRERRKGRGEDCQNHRSGGSIQEAVLSLLLLPLSISLLSLLFCPRAGDRETTAQLDTNVTPAAKVGNNHFAD